MDTVGWLYQDWIQFRPYNTSWQWVCSFCLQEIEWMPAGVFLPRSRFVSFDWITGPPPTPFSVLILNLLRVWSYQLPNWLFLNIFEGECVCVDAYVPGTASSVNAVEIARIAQPNELEATVTLERLLMRSRDGAGVSRGLPGGDEIQGETTGRTPADTGPERGISFRDRVESNFRCNPAQIFRIFGLPCVTSWCKWDETIYFPEKAMPIECGFRKSSYCDEIAKTANNVVWNGIMAK